MIENTIQIGAQIWMTRNLNVAHFVNGNEIMEAKTAEDWKAAGDNEKPAWCYYNNESVNGEKYGKLYNWYAVNDPRGLAPSGWKLPDGNDVLQLLVFLNATDGRSHNIIKSITGWKDYEHYGETYRFNDYLFESSSKFVSGNGTNDSGYNGLPGGGRSRNGDFMYDGSNGFFWTRSILMLPYSNFEKHEFEELKFSDQLGLIKLSNDYLTYSDNQKIRILNEEKNDSESSALVFGLHSYEEYDPFRNVAYYESIFSSGHKQSGFSVRCIKKDEILSKTFLSAASKNGKILNFMSDEIKKKKEFVLASVQQNGSTLEHASDDLKDDKEVVLAAVQQSFPGSNQKPFLQFASERLRKDKEVVLTAVKNNGKALKYASDELKNDREIVLSAVQQYAPALEFASNSLKNEREIVLSAIQNDISGVYPAALFYSSDNLKDDRELVMLAVKKNNRAIKNASSRLKNDKEIILYVVENYGEALQYASVNLKNDREIVKLAVNNNGEALKYASDELKNDREIVLLAVNSNGSNLDYASEILKNDYEIILSAFRSIIKNCFFDEDNFFINLQIEKLYSCCSVSILKSVLLTICQDCTSDAMPLPFELSDELSNNRSFIIDAVKINGLILYNASDKLKSDSEVVLQAFKNDKNSLQFADAILKSNKEFLHQISLIP